MRKMTPSFILLPPLFNILHVKNLPHEDFKRLEDPESRAVAAPDPNLPASFPRFTSLPTELRMMVWRWVLALEEGTRRVDLEGKVSAASFERTYIGWVLPTRSLISPLLLVNRESRGEALRRYPKSMRVFRPGVSGRQEHKHQRQVPVGRVHVNWHHDTFYVGTIRRVGDWADKGPWVPDLAHWVQCRARDREYRDGETGRIRITFEARPEGWCYLPRLRLDQREERDNIILAVRNLFV
ncbi:hypothetical protein PG997_010821 [Apiospora hydei]|uniref:2EXR domain-containing protein n=1 Tax=Apiospora hydei TaxID=1337664 RepID=A0ABR1VH97_9PEZI